MPTDERMPAPGAGADGGARPAAIDGGSLSTRPDGAGGRARQVPSEDAVRTPPPGLAGGTGGGARRFPSGRAMAAMAAAIIVLDQVSKGLVHAWLPLHASVTIVPGLLDFRYVRNTGAAFGLLNAADIPFKPALMTAIALTALIAIVLYASRVSSEQPLARVGLAAVLGGAIGNLVDRIRAGYVVDFVDVYVGTWHFWAFNVADAAITVGAGCLILDMLRAPAHASDSA